MKRDVMPYPKIIVVIILSTMFNVCVWILASPVLAGAILTVSPIADHSTKPEKQRIKKKKKEQSQNDPFLKTTKDLYPPLDRKTKSRLQQQYKKDRKNIYVGYNKKKRSLGNENAKRRGEIKKKTHKDYLKKKKQWSTNLNNALKNVSSSKERRQLRYKYYLQRKILRREARSIRLRQLAVAADENASMKQKLKTENRESIDRLDKKYRKRYKSLREFKEYDI